jgi:hypothetical protein
MANWLYLEQEEQKGPVSDEGLRALARKGVITPQTRIWKEGMADWVNAGKVKGLFAPAPPPVPGQFTADKYCRNCGTGMSAQAVACLSCGCPPVYGNSFCPHCGATTHAQAIICVKCGQGLASVPTENPANPARSSPYKTMWLWLVCVPHRHILQAQSQHKIHPRVFAANEGSAKSLCR